MSSGPQRSFAPEDQAWFAALSGDHNPIHVDPVRARRTAAGQPVVHGVHTLLWALDAIASGAGRPPRPTALRADFTSFLMLGRTAALGPLAGEGTRRATVTADGLPVMRLELRYGTAGPTPPTPRVDGDATPDTLVPRELGLDDIGDQRGSVAFAAEASAVAARFPAACDWLGADTVQGLLASTRLVGMACPGLHSIFNRIDAALVPAQGPGGRLSWSVAAVDARFRRVTLAVAARDFAATLFATVRHAPTAQPTVAALAQAVEPGLFAGQRALVVGGSRGLGELAAKLLAAGGAEVAITFAHGRDDAERVAAEIGAWGGSCATLRHDVTAAPGAEVAAEAARATQAYYFATPTIYAPSSRLFDPDTFRRFCGFYVEGFATLCGLLGGAGPVGVFYPSTAFLDEPRRDMPEYRMAKAAGEVLCDALGRARADFRVVRSRLPALLTDQTAAVGALDGLELLLPLVREVQAR